MAQPNSSTNQPAPRAPAAARVAGSRVRPDLALILFLTLLGTYAYFWQSRDWNSASRLMLTYSLVDRRQIEIDGLEGQAGQRELDWTTGRYKIVAGDLAYFGGHYYTDKAPGQSLLGAVVYAIGRLVGLPQHPLDHPRDPNPARAYWSADYWVTLGTSGVLTALVAVVIYALTLRLGGSHGGGVLLGLAYGLGSPAIVYATLFYGHQAAAFCTMTSFFLLYRAGHEGRANAWNMIPAGLLAGYALVVEYQVAVISAALAVYAACTIRRAKPVTTFVVSAALAAGLLAAYNYRAFGSPLDLGYAHEVFPEFRAVHSAANPLGLRLPEWETARDVLSALLWGRHRGIAVYAPILLAAPVGLLVLVCRNYRGVALVIVAAVAWMLLLNVSYPKWEGGWCTGPRLLVPAFPFAMLAVGGLLALPRRGVFMALLAIATTVSGLLMLACVAVGGRFPPYRLDPAARRELPLDPWTQVVFPRWQGRSSDETTPIAGGRQFEWNAGRWLMEHLLPERLSPREPSPWQALQFVPVGAFWILMLGLLASRTRAGRAR